jgi:hypothetical protein
MHTSKEFSCQDASCEVQSYTLRSDVHLRYATSMLRVQVANPERNWRTQDCTINVVIPEAAFLSGVLAYATFAPLVFLF